MREIEIRDLCRYVNPMMTDKDWALIAASDGEEMNAMTVGWASFGTLWSKPAATVYIHKSRYSKQIFDHAQYYSVCFMKPEHRKILSYFGSVSGRDENKMEKGGLHVNTEEAAPYFEESRAVVLCRVMGRSDFDPDSVDDGVRDWYRAEGVHTQYYGEIVKVLVSDTDESR